MGGQGDFLLQSAFASSGDAPGGRGGVASREIVVRAGEEFPVTVLFAPQKRAPREAALRIRQLDTRPMKYTVCDGEGKLRGR